jgi:hypothetical protein
MAEENKNDDAVEDGYLVTLNGRAWGISLGLLAGIGLFLATMILVLKGGPDTGRHLGLLGQYFPGYDVTFLGALIGFAYAFVAAYLLGRLICFVYNLSAKRR